MPKVIHKIMEKFTSGLCRLPLWRHSSGVNALGLSFEKERPAKKASSNFELEVNSVSKFEHYIKYMSNWRKAAYASTVLLSLLTLATLCPISFSSNELVEAATGTAQDSTLTFSFVNNRSTASVSLNVTDANGTFATSTDGTNNTVDERAAFSLTTNNATGYTVAIRTSGTDYTLGSTIETLSSTKTASNFELNKWGLLPSKVNGDDNNGTNANYYPAYSTITIDETDTANSTANEYIIGLGIKADYTIPAGTYNNTTLIVEYVANPVNYTITYNKNTTDTVTNMPYSSNNYQQAGDTSATSITLSNLVPVRDGYDFLGWCNGTVTTNTTTNIDSCTGTIYNPDGDGANLTFGIDKTTTNIVTIKAMWKRGKIYMWDATFADCGETMYDNRDGTERAYTTASITAGGDTLCWMTTNLSLGKSTTTQLTADTSNVSSAGYTLPASSTTGFSDNTAANIYNSNSTTCSSSSSCYGYYTWVAATAGSTKSSGDAEYDICPSGWRLPTSGEYTALKNIYTTGASLTSGVFLATYSGRYYNGSFGNGGSVGLYWSSTAYSSTISYTLRYNSTSATVRSSDSKYYGFPIRCVKTAPATPKITVTFAGSGVSSVKVCKTSGDCSGTNLLGKVSISGGSVSGLEYDSTYYLYPTFSTGYQLSSWSKTSSTGTLSSTSATNPTFTNGSGDGAVAITGKAKTFNLVVTGDSNVPSLTIKKGSTSGTSTSCTKSGTTFTCSSLDYGTKYYLYPTFASGYIFNSWAKTDSATNASLGSTSTMNTYYQMGNGAGALTLSTKSCTSTTFSGYMQDMTASTVTNACVGDSGTLTDRRDNKTYKVAKLADNKLWMLDNLALDIATLTKAELYGSGTTAGKLTNASETTLGYLKNGGGSSPYTATAVANATSDFYKYDVPQINTASINTVPSNAPAGSLGSNKVGIYYNYCAATAGSYCYPHGSSSGDASEDVCPYGWRMPTGGSSGEYQALYTAYSSNATNFKKALSTPLSGLFYYSSADEQGSNGYFWCSTRRNDIDMGSLYVYPGSVVPADYANRNGGFSVRCLLK